MGDSLEGSTNTKTNKSGNEAAHSMKHEWHTQKKREHHSKHIQTALHISPMQISLSSTKHKASWLDENHEAAIESSAAPVQARVWVQEFHMANCLLYFHDSEMGNTVKEVDLP